MVKYEFNLGNGSGFKFIADFSREGDIYLILPHVVKVSFHRSGEAHLKPTKGGPATPLDLKALTNDMEKKKSQKPMKTGLSVPNVDGCIAILRPSFFRSEIEFRRDKIMNMFNSRNITLNSLLLGNAVTTINLDDMSRGLEKLTAKQKVKDEDLLLVSYFDDGKFHFSYGNLNERFCFQIDPYDVKSLNSLPGFEVFYPVFESYISQFGSLDSTNIT